MTNALSAFLRQVCVDPAFRLLSEQDLEAAMTQHELSEDAKSVLRAQDNDVMSLLAHAVAGQGHYAKPPSPVLPAATKSPQRLPEVQFLLRIRPVVAVDASGSLQISHQAKVQPIQVPDAWLGEQGGPSPEDPWALSTTGLDGTGVSEASESPTRLAAIQQLVSSLLGP